MTNIINLKPAHQLARERAISRHPSTQEAPVVNNFKQPIGSSEAVLSLLQRTPDRKWSNKELAKETGYSDTQVQTALLHLRRKGLPISGEKGIYWWTNEWKPTKLQLQRMVSLYELMLSEATKNDDSVPVFRGSYQRVMSPRAKQYFRVRGSFSENAVSTAYRHLVRNGSIEIRGDWISLKFLLKHPLDIFDNPGGVRRYDKSVHAPKVGKVEETFFPSQSSQDLATVASSGTREDRRARIDALVGRWHSLTEAERGFHSVVGTSLNGHTLVQDGDGELYELRPV